ncbi:MAG: YceI family protein [Legionella sp.]|uniref:YceI family protein n=1 Tax=Legionella sp. TaxID=459 RepID=UPI0039E4FDD5
MKLLHSIFFCVFTISSIAYADILPQWNIIPTESSISFTGTQNGAPVTGSFKSFTGTVIADPIKYQDSSIDIIVQTGSLSVSYAELANILVTPDWFNVKEFPKAEFKATKFNKIDNSTYQAIGDLTIKNKSAPATFTFTAIESSKNHWIVTGHATIKRSAFSVGIGEWANTDVVKDDVIINFKIAVIPKS